MRIAFLREKVMAGVCCLVGVTACLIMWHEAGLNQPDRRINLFGGPRSTPFWEQRYPESKIFFSGCGFGAMLLGLFGFGGRRGVESPEILHGPAFILIGVLLAMFLIQARTVNDVSMEVHQPGFYLALAALTGLVVAGCSVIVRAWRA